MGVFVKAGFRPFLQSTMLSKALVWKSSATPGHPKVFEWDSILQHCRQLRLCNEAYARRVARHVTEVMENAGADNGRSCPVLR